MLFEVSMLSDQKHHKHNMRLYIYIPINKVGWGYKGITMSVRLSCKCNSLTNENLHNCIIEPQDVH